MDPFVLDILLEVVKAIFGVVVPALTVFLMYRTKRMNDKMKKNDLKNEVNRLTQYADQLKSFSTLTIEERKDAIMESIRLFAMDNEIVISDTEMEFMVEQSLQSLRRLVNIGFKLRQEKQNEFTKKHIN